VDAAQFPVAFPNSWVTEISPELSKAKTFDARSAALLVKSVLVMVLVLDSFMDRSTSS
jgi:hypothetical protein|tara:strand:- start:24 stop:197 length:174 start_codon:yes stop_codon:yes gene_type:complete